MIVRIGIINNDISAMNGIISINSVSKSIPPGSGKVNDILGNIARRRRDNSPAIREQK